MTHRATLKRPQTSPDAWNRPAVDSLASQGKVACRVYQIGRPGSLTTRLVLDANKTARTDELGALFPLSLDVRAEDELADITDRNGTVLYEGPFVIRAPIRRRAHQEARLEGHGVGA